MENTMENKPQEPKSFESFEDFKDFIIKQIKEKLNLTTQNLGIEIYDDEFNKKIMEGGEKGTLTRYGVSKIRDFRIKEEEEELEGKFHYKIQCKITPIMKGTDGGEQDVEFKVEVSFEVEEEEFLEISINPYDIPDHIQERATESIKESRGRAETVHKKNMRNAFLGGVPGSGKGGK
ncbi:MAG: hypothetical protein GF335_00175 [Candidatus Moranbacteria bacterium]|nr:hypothetical protein [Candidatus Moranbacteria bacterium]